MSVSTKLKERSVWSYSSMFEVSAPAFKQTVNIVQNLSVALYIRRCGNLAHIKKYDLTHDDNMKKIMKS